jgi:hypothetical protein
MQNAKCKIAVKKRIARGVRKEVDKRALPPVIARSERSERRSNLYKTRNAPFYIEIAASRSALLAMTCLAVFYLQRGLPAPHAERSGQIDRRKWTDSVAAGHCEERTQ